MKVSESMSGFSEKTDNKVRGTSVAIDNGGSKALAIRFDRDFRPVASVKTGSLRFNTNSPEVIDQRVREMIAGLGFEQGDVIDDLCGVFPAAVAEIFKKHIPVTHVSNFGELGTSLAAAEIFGDGIIAICGTGVSIFARYRGKTYALGGYGSLISDEGSGYYIARQAYTAAIHAFEGRGPGTVLTDIIARKYGGNGPQDFREAVFSIYGRESKSLVSEIASLTPLVVKAAESDEVAAQILRDAGKLVGEQLLALVRSNSLPHDLPIAVSGSVWKNDPVLFGAFKDTVAGTLSDPEIVIPRFLPVVGPVILKMLEKNRESGIDHLTDEDERILDQYSREFGFSV